MPDPSLDPLNESDEPRNPLDLPPLSMTDDEWADWCERLDIDNGT